MRRAVIGGLIGLAAVLVLVVFQRSRQSAPIHETSPQVSVATATYGTFAVVVTAFGRIGAPAGSMAKPAFAVNGILAGIDVRIGQHVQAGQPLAHLDTGGLALSAAQAGAEAAAANAGYGGGAVPAALIQTARAKVAAAKTRLDALEHGSATAQIRVQSDAQALARERQLFAAGVAARKDVDAAAAQLAADRSESTGALSQARADYAQAVSDLQSAQTQPRVLSAQALSAQERSALANRDVANGTLYAPADGVVTAIYKHKGESVDATTAVVALGSSQQRIVTLEVAAGDARRVAFGNHVTVKLTGAGASASGRVTGVSPSVDAATGRATVTVDAIPPGSLAGDAVEAFIVVAVDRGVIVPATSIVQDPQSGKTVVFVRSQKDGTFGQRAVTVAQSDTAKALVASGLRPGEKVAAQGAFALLAPSGG